MKANKITTSTVLLAGTIAVLTGCAATQTALERRTMEGRGVFHSHPHWHDGVGLVWLRIL